MSWPERIKAIRAALEVSPLGLADRLGVSPQSVRRYEAGETIPRGRIQAKIEVVERGIASGRFRPEGDPEWPARVAAIMEAMEWSQYRMAEATGIPVANINRWLRGASRPMPVWAQVLEGLEMEIRRTQKA